jgi:hypothetical protein
MIDTQTSARELMRHRASNNWRTFLLIAVQIVSSLAYCRENVQSAESRVIVEDQASADVIRSLSNIFERGSRLTVYYTSENEMGRLGFDARMARELARFTYSVDCRGNCAVEFRELLKDLSQGRAIRGDCPGPVTTAIDLRDPEGNEVASINATADGQCFELNHRSYFLSSTAIVEKFKGIARVLK